MATRQITWRLALGIACTTACAGRAGSPGNPSGAGIPIPIGITVQNFDLQYPVRGRTAAAILSEMRAGGPVLQGRRYFGTSTWTLRYRWGSTSTGIGTCSVHGIKVLVLITTTMPEWLDADSANAELRGQWAAFVSALRTHEEGHRRIAVEEAIAVKRRLDDLRVADCSLYVQEAELAYRRQHAIHYARDVEYDASTRHGVLQGAVWPPPPSVPPGR